MTIQELADRAEVTTRTIRYYVEQGVLPPPERGRPAEYKEEHVARLALIKRLKAQYLPLEEIRDTMQRLSLQEVEALVAGYSPQEEQTQKLSSAGDYIAHVLGRGMVREQMKQGYTAADKGRRTKDEGRPIEQGRERAITPGAAAPYAEPSLAQAPAQAAPSAPSKAAAPVPPATPAPGTTAPESPAPSLASRLWSSVVGRRSSAAGAATAETENAYIQAPTSWQRVQLGEGIELHYLASQDARFNEMVSRLIEAAHRILDEGPGNGE
jgi:DNA-binding transcriptional MerR regulator